MRISKMVWKTHFVERTEVVNRRFPLGHGPAVYGRDGQQETAKCHRQLHLFRVGIFLPSEYSPV